MRRPRSATRVTGPAYRVLAALLLADGAALEVYELADELFPWQVSPMSIWQHMANLRRFGVVGVERAGAGRFRLSALPPDEHLEPMLAVVPEVKRSRWWKNRSSVTMAFAS